MPNRSAADRSGLSLHGARWRGSELPALYHGLAFPEGPWSPRETRSPSGAFPLDFWNPLLHLLLGPLGWADPALGITRWVDRGMPVLDPATEVLKAWWGEDALMLAAWDQQSEPVPSRIAREVAKICGTISPARADGAAGAGMTVRVLQEWSARFSEGWDPGVAASDVVSMLCGPGADPANPRPMPSVNPRGSPPGSPDDHRTLRGGVLVLPDYQGWLRILHQSADHQPGPIDVLVRPIGWLGTYLKSDETGRMHAASRETHLLGW